MSRDSQTLESTEVFYKVMADGVVSFESKVNDVEEDRSFELAEDEWRRFRRIVDHPGFIDFVTRNTLPCRDTASQGPHGFSDLVVRFSDGGERTISDYTRCILDVKWDLGQLGYQVVELNALLAELAEAYLDCALPDLSDGLPNPTPADIGVLCSGVWAAASYREVLQCEAGQIANDTWDYRRSRASTGSGAP